MTYARWRLRFEKEGDLAVATFIKAHRGYSVDADRLDQGHTNHVIAGHHGKQPVIFKFFCEVERKDRELFGLRHFASTNLVPQILNADHDRLIVMSRIPGTWLHVAAKRDVNPPFDPGEVGLSLGHAAARLTCVPISPADADLFEGRFYSGQALHEYFQEIIRASQSIPQRMTHYQDPTFRRSLDFIDAQLDHLLCQPRILYHQDAVNMSFVENRLSGFFDLGMCRVGTQAMQIGSLWGTGGCRMWPSFLQGFEAGTHQRLTQDDVRSALAFAHFMVWRSISKYGQWCGQPLEASKAVDEANKAREYLAALQSHNEVLGIQT